MGPDGVSVQSNFMQLDTQDLPGWKRTTNNSGHRSCRLARTCSRAETVQKLEQSYLIEDGGPVLVVVEAGNVLTNAAAGGLVFRRDVDLILENQTVKRLKAGRKNNP